MIVRACAFLAAFSASAMAADVEITGDVSPAPASSPTWTIPGALTIGLTANGTMAVSGNGSVSNTSGIIASGASSVSSVSVSGGTWTNSSFIAVGNSGNGTLQISGSGNVFSTTTALAVNPGSTGTLQVTTGGTLTARQVSEGSGNGAVTFNDGTLRLTGNQTDLFAGFEAGDIILVGASTIDTQGFNVATSLGLAGGGELNKQGSGTLTLTGNNTYTGRTHVRSGTLALVGTGRINSVFGAVNVGQSSGEVGTFILSDDAVVNVARARMGSTANSTGTAIVTGGTWNTSSSFFVGELGNGTLNLSNGTINTNAHGFIAALPGSTGTANVSGGSWLNAGDIGLGNGGHGTLNLSGTGLVSSRSVIVAGTPSTTGILNLNGGTLRTGQVGEGSGTGTVTFNGGTLRLSGNQANLFGGFETGDVTIASGGATIDTQNFAVSSAAAIGGVGGLTKSGNGTLTLSGTNSYAGATVIADGSFAVNGSLASSSVTMGNSTTLSGNGTIAGPVTLGANVTINPGDGVGTLTTGNLTLNSSTILNFGLGPVAASDRIAVNGNLTLDGTLNIADLIGFGAGTYRLFDYTGSLTDNGLLFGIVPGAFDLSLSTTTSNQVNLVVTSAAALYWDGPNTTPQGVAGGSGGSGTWNAALTNWTNAAGLANAAWLGISSAVFGGANGTVTIADGFTATTPKITFATDGYTLAAAGNGSLSLTGSGIVTVANGTATISAPVTGSSRIEKQGPGTLVVSGNNTYSNATWIREGTLNLTGSISHPAEDIAVGRYFGDVGFLLLGGNASLTNRTGFIGVDAGSTGTVNMSGGTWSNSDELRVGDFGTGTLTFTGGNITSTIGNIARSFGSTGTVNMSGGNWTNSDQFVVGNRGVGTFTLSNGTLSSVTSTIGLNVGGTGNATITGGTWANSDELRVGEFGSGTLAIAGGNVTSTIGNIARSGDSTGTVTMTGGSWTNSSEFVVGNRGVGTFTLSNGTLSSVVSTIGLNTGGTGNATITGGTWASSSELRVGDFGSGTLHINGGNITNTIGNLARNGGSYGEVTMSNGTWTNSDLLVIGNAGQGSLNQTGGHITNTDGEIGYSSGGSGEATVSGGTWTNTGNLTIGRAGTGILSVLAGSTLDVDGRTIYLGRQGDGQGTLNFGSSDLNNPTGAGTVNADAFVFGPGTGIINFNQNNALHVSATISGNGSVVQRGSGTTTLTGNHTYSGATTVSAGTLLVNGSLLNSQTTVRNGATLGGSGQLGSILLEDGGTLAPGNSPGTLTASSLVWNSGGSMMIELGTDAASSDDLDLGDFLRGTGSNFNFTFVDNGWVIGQTYTLVTFTNTTFTLGDFGFTNGGGFDGTFALAAGSLDFTLTAIPEPSTVALLLLALAAAVFLRRRMAV